MKATVNKHGREAWIYFWRFHINFHFAASTAHKSAPPAKAPKTSSSDSGDESDHEESSSSQSSSQSARKSSRTIVAMRRPSIMAAAALKTHHYGSFYLRMGAVGEFFFHNNRKNFYLCLHLSSHFTSHCRIVLRLGWIKWREAFLKGSKNCSSF